MLSIVIPTRNRGLFLERLLSYYKEQDLQEPILIADSSNPNERTQVTRAVEAAGKHLNMDYRYYGSDIGIAEKLSDILMLVRTDLVVVGADDDFFTLRGLRHASDFLQRHSEFSLAHGRAVTFELNPGPVYGNHLAVASYLQRSIEHPAAAERLLDHLAHYSTTWYSVHRTADLRQNMRTVAELDMEPVSFTELLPSCLSVVQGKAKKLEVLYAVRQVHLRNERGLPDVFDWMVNPSWAAQFSRFRRRVAVKNVMAQRAPGLVKAWQLGRSFLPGEDNRMLLPSLLRPSSPYHTDFMPVYRAIGACRMETS